MGSPRRAALAACVLVVLAGCGSADSTNADSTNGASTNGASTNATNESVGQLTPVAAVAKMVETSKSASTATYTVTTTAPQGTTTMRGAFRAGPNPAQRMSLDSSGLRGLPAGMGDMEAVLIGEVMYLRMGDNPAMASLAAGREWLKVSLADLGRLTGLGDVLSNLTQNDPRESMQTMLASPNVRAAGQETVDGVSTTRYVGDVSASDVAGSLDLDEDSRREFAKLNEMAGTTTSHIEVWIDAQHQVRRAVTSADTKLGTVTTDMRMSDWGKPVDIAAPAPDAVTDLGAMLAQLPGA